MVKKQKQGIKWTKVLIKLLGFILMVIVILATISYLKTKSEIENLPSLSTINARDYKLTDKDIYKGEIKRCTDWNNPLYGWCYKSPYFPFTRLSKVIVKIGYPIIISNTQIGKEIDKSTETRYLMKDSIWNLYFIYSQTGYGPEKYFGPFQETL